MKMADNEKPKSLELLGNILKRTLRDMILRENRIKQERKHHMDDCYDDFDGPDWEDSWMIIGPLSEDIAREKRDIERARREWDDQDDDYWDIINRQ